MKLKARLFACLLAGQLAWFFGAALNVPIWREWDTGDRSDMLLAASLLTWVLTGKRQ